MRRYIDLALSGTGPDRFAVWVGVLKYIEERGYSVRRLAGTSGGALVGGLYMSGLSASDLVGLVETTDSSKLVHITKFSLAWAVFMPRSLGGGYADNGFRLERYLAEQTGYQMMGDVPGLKIVAADLTNKRTVVFDGETHPEYPLARAIRASVSIPIAFDGVPYVYDEMPEGSGVHSRRAMLFDGGNRNNFAIDLLQSKQEFDRTPLVGFVLTPCDRPMSEKPEGYELLSSVLTNFIDAQEDEQKEDVAGLAGIVEVPVERKNHLLDFDVPLEEKQRQIEVGYNAAADAWDYLVAGDDQVV